jgi:putative ABC transport system permease protein
VEAVTYANWFQGVYIDKNQFFARLAVDAETIFDVYPEFKVSKEEYQNFLKERNSCIIGEAIANQYNLKIGDLMTIEGDIYPGDWQFVVRGIYKPRDKTTDPTQMFFHWDYLNERLKEWETGRENEVGWYIIKIKDPDKSASVSDQIDALFQNSRAETKTESERAFQQGFVQSSSAIITSMNVISFVIIGIIMLVLGNTMIMSARERTREYAVFKTIGFSAKHMVGLILGESLFISAIGGSVGLALSFYVIEGMSQVIPKGFFPVFELEPITLIFAVSSALLIGIAASIFPILKALRTSIVDGLRFIG